MCRWTYRIHPTVMHKPFAPCDAKRFERWLSVFDSEDKRLHVTPQQFRWKAQRFPTDKTTFIEGIVTMGGAGGPMMKDGVSILLYACNASMEKEAFYNSDGDFLIVPQHGALLVKTELGRIRVEPLEICVI